MTLPNSLPKSISNIVVIPVFREENWRATAYSLLHTEPPKGQQAIFWIVNESEAADDDWKQFAANCAQEMQDFFFQNKAEHILNFVHLEFLQDKHAGVGLARKTGMDKACEILISNQQVDGAIVCLDADCTVSSNYFRCLENALDNHPNAPGAALYFEHPLTGNNATAIAHYEYFLRYYNSALRWCGHPFAFHTVGSSMLVRAKFYRQQGGMNKRKAGEDFYFLNKIIELGNFIEINSLCVYPSNRNSDRVPFGTGRAMEDFHQKEKAWFYDERIFISLKRFFEGMKSYPPQQEWKHYADPLILEFLQHENCVEEIEAVYLHSAGAESFVKRFFRLFNLFTVLKCVHYLSDQHFPRSKGIQTTQWLLNELKLNFHEDVVQNLVTIRNYERSA